MYTVVQLLLTTLVCDSCIVHSSHHSKNCIPLLSFNFAYTYDCCAYTAVEFKPLQNPTIFFMSCATNCKFDLYCKLVVTCYIQRSRTV